MQHPFPECLQMFVSEMQLGWPTSLQWYREWRMILGQLKFW